MDDTNVPAQAPAPAQAPDPAPNPAKTDSGPDLDKTAPDKTAPDKTATDKTVTDPLKSSGSDTSSNTYTLDPEANYHEASHFTDRTKWRCYLGRTSTDPHNPNQKVPTLKGVDWYDKEGPQDWQKEGGPAGPLTNKEPWLEDPTKGIVTYYRACEKIKEYIVPGEKPKKNNDKKGIDFKVAKTAVSGGDAGSGRFENHKLKCGYNLEEYIAAPRIESVKMFNKDSVFVIDVQQIPGRCGAWPAFWLLGTGDDWESGEGDEWNDGGAATDGRKLPDVTTPKECSPGVGAGAPEVCKGGEVTKSSASGGYKSTKEWPASGEIDIIEAVHGGHNNVTLHSCGGCKIIKQMESGDTLVPYKDGGQEGGFGALGKKSDFCGGPNPGCRDDGDSHTGCGGTIQDVIIDNINKTGGGQFICEWLVDKSVKVWFINRVDVMEETNISIEGGKYNGKLPNLSYDISGCKTAEGTSMFKNMHMIINTTFCGEWASRDRGEGNNNKCVDKWSKPDPQNSFKIDKGKLNFYYMKQETVRNCALYVQMNLNTPPSDTEWWPTQEEYDKASVKAGSHIFSHDSWWWKINSVKVYTKSTTEGFGNQLITTSDPLVKYLLIGLLIIGIYVLFFMDKKKRKKYLKF